MALKSTTTPALTTQVIRVGEMSSSSAEAPRRFFLVSRRSRDGDLRLPLPGREGALEDVTEERRGKGRGVGSGEVARRADSGTSRKEEGSMRFEELAATVG